MRISDWSSDVCSSDLFERIIVPDHDVAGAARAQRPDAALHADGARGYAADRGEGLIPAHPARARHARQPDEVARILRRIAHLVRSEEHTSELQSLMRLSYAVFCLKKKKVNKNTYRSSILLTTSRLHSQAQHS